MEITYTTGKDIFVEIYNTYGMVYNPSTTFFEKYNSETDYGIDLTESTENTYELIFPDISSGNYICEFYIDDELIYVIDTTWDGSDVTESIESNNIGFSSYINVSAANYYMYNRLTPESWEDATTNNKLKALNMATAAIDKLNFIGDKTSEDQPHQFPRDDDTDYPEAIKEATALCAAKFLDDFTLDEMDEELRFVKQKYGNVEHTYNDYKPLYISAGIPSAEAWALIYPFLREKWGVRVNKVT